MWAYAAAAKAGDDKKQSPYLEYHQLKFLLQLALNLPLKKK
jgi:hypothetical protein